jgi:uncharacterized protein with GYD domain
MSRGLERKEDFYDHIYHACKLDRSRCPACQGLAASSRPGEAALKDMDGEFKSFFLTMGDYDIVAVYEAPDDAVAARFNLQLGMLGNIRTHTLKAFPETAYREIIKSLG